MIQLIETFDEPLKKELDSFCSGSLLGVKAIGPLLSYGTAYPFVSAWIQTDEEGNKVGFLSKCYGTVVAFQTEGVSRDALVELKEFLSVIGYGYLISTAAVTDTEPCFCQMKLEKGKDCIATQTTENVQFIENEDLPELYRLVAQNNPGYVAEDLSAWLVDFSHRTRHNTAHSVLLKAKGTYCATAAALSITEPAVFLGAISTNFDCRGRHYASSCIRFLTEKYKDRTIYLSCRPEKQAFYEKLGFSKVGSYAEKKGYSLC